MDSYNRVMFVAVSICVVLQFVTCCHHDGCERISHSFNIDAVKVANESDIMYQNFTFPVNITVYYTSGHETNASFFAAFPKYYNNSRCKILRTFENDCLATNQCRNREVMLSEGGGQTSIKFILHNLTVSQDGTRIDMCTHCGGSYICFPPVYLTVNGPPVNLSEYVSVSLTCRGIVITGIIDTDTELLIIIEDTNNETVYQETTYTLPFVISGNKIGSNFNPAANYTLFITGKNPAGIGETLQRNVSFKNFIKFKMNSINFRIVNDHPVAIINLTFNRSCPVSIPRHIKVEADCIHEGHEEVFLNKSSIIRIRLSREATNCVLKLSSGRKQKSMHISVRIIQDVSISSCDGGYFIITATLLPGATGIAMRVFDSHRNLLLSPKIWSDNEELIVANSSEKLNPGNYTVKINYLNEDGTIDNSSIQYYFNLSCSRVDDITPTTTDRNTSVTLIIVVVVVCVIMAIVAITVIVIILVVLKRRCKKGKCIVSRKRVKFSANPTTVTIVDSEQKTSETEGGVPHSVPVVDTESHTVAQPHPPRKYPQPEIPPVTVPTDTPTNTDASTKPLLDKDAETTKVTTTVTSQSSTTAETQSLIPDSKNEKKNFVAPKIKIPPQLGLGTQKGPEKSLQNLPSSSTVLIPDPQTNRPKGKTVPLPPASRVVPPPNNQEEDRLEINQESGGGSSTYYCSLTAGNKSEGEKKDNEKDKICDPTLRNSLF